MKDMECGPPGGRRGKFCRAEREGQDKMRTLIAACHRATRLPPQSSSPPQLCLPPPLLSTPRPPFQMMSLLHRLDQSRKRHTHIMPPRPPYDSHKGVRTRTGVGCGGPDVWIQRTAWSATNLRVSNKGHNRTDCVRIQNVCPNCELGRRWSSSNTSLSVHMYKYMTRLPPHSSYDQHRARPSLLAI